MKDTLGLWRYQVYGNAIQKLTFHIVYVLLGIYEHHYFCILWLTTYTFELMKTILPPVLCWWPRMDMVIYMGDPLAIIMMTTQYIDICFALRSGSADMILICASVDVRQLLLQVLQGSLQEEMKADFWIYDFGLILEQKQWFQRYAISSQSFHPRLMKLGMYVLWGRLQDEHDEMEPDFWTYGTLSPRLSGEVTPVTPAHPNPLSRAGTAVALLVSYPGLRIQCIRNEPRSARQPLSWLNAINTRELKHN